MSEVSRDPSVQLDTDAVPGKTPAKSGGAKSGLAVCLSGGSFRAALFHVGALRRMHECGVFADARTISSVSGGSILSAFIAGKMISRGAASAADIKDWEVEIAAPFREVAGRDLRTIPVLANLPWNWAFPSPRVRQLERRYAARVTRAALSELPTSPRFVLCATDLAFGVDWEFSKDRCGDWLAGYARDGETWPIARAVAASACFPPLFGPLSLGLKASDMTGGNASTENRERLTPKIGLTDGGVYDNMALEPAWKTHECVLVSDCGGPFAFDAGNNYISRLKRYAAVGMNQAAAMRKRAFFETIDESNPARPAKFRGGYWGLAGTVKHYLQASTVSIGSAGYSDTLVSGSISRIRTDLDRFTQAEMRILENHGYQLASAVLARRRPELIPPSSPPPATPHEEWLDEDEVRHALRGSHRHVFLPRLLKLGDQK